MPKIVFTHDLGGNNDGKIGPNGLSDEQVSALIADSEKPEYHLPATRRFICVDGRGTTQDQTLTNALEGYADPQTAGSLVITLTSARIMTFGLAKPLSELIGQSTRDIVASDYQTIMHGDAMTGKRGCGANTNQRAILARNAENADIVAPVVWELAKKTGLSEQTQIIDGAEMPLISQDDLLDLIVRGGEAASGSNDDLWDAEPEEVTNIAVKNGAEYIEVSGSHTEAVLAVTTDKGGVFDNRRFAHDHKHSETGEEVQAFAVALGCLQEAIFEIVEHSGGTKREAALLTLAAFCVNSGTAKKLKNDRLLAAVFA